MCDELITCHVSIRRGSPSTFTFRTRSNPRRLQIASKLSIELWEQDFRLLRTNVLTGVPSRVSCTPGYFSQLNMGVGTSFPPSSIISKAIFHDKAGVGTGRISHPAGRCPGPPPDNFVLKQNTCKASIVFYGGKRNPHQYAF